MMNIIDRKKYIDKVLKSLGKEQIVVLTGQRRVGKSYILKLICARLEADDSNNVIYIDKEKREFDDIRSYEDLNAYIDSYFVESKHTKVSQVKNLIDR